MFFEQVCGTIGLRIRTQMNTDPDEGRQSAYSVADPGSGIRCHFYPWIRDLGWVKNLDPDPG
jgi:hypothetical protein